MTDDEEPEETILLGYCCEECGQLFDPVTTDEELREHEESHQ